MNLKEYIKSGGVLVPAGPLPPSANCCFCSSPHDYIGVYHHLSYPTFDQSVLLPNAFSCDNCAVKIFQMEQTFVGGRSPREDLFSQTIRRTPERILEFVKHGRFDESVHLHYRVPDLEDDPLHPMRSKCYFCGNTVLDSQFYLIQVPVNNFSLLTGGEVCTCPGCYHESVRIAVEQGLIGPEKKIAMTYPVDRCARCGVDYPLAHSELEVRGYNKTVKKHLCPDCTYKRLVSYSNRDDDSALTKVLQTLIVGNSPLTERTVHVKCAYCRLSFAIDKTISDYALQKYIGKTGPICEYCKTPDKEVDEVIFLDKDTVRIFLFGDDTLRITRSTAAGQIITTILHPKKGAVLQAIEEYIHKLFVKQPELL